MKESIMDDTTQEPQEQAEATDSTVDEPQETTQEPQEEPEKAAESREAAKYRTRLREAEAQRDDLAQQLEESRKQIVEGMSRLTRPEALWVAGIDVNDLLDDAGRVDPKKVSEATAAASESLGLATRPTGPYSSAFKDMTGEPVTPKPDFATAFKPEPK